MYALIISHEARSLARTSMLSVLLTVLACAIAFAAWSGRNMIDRQMQGADAAIAFEAGMRDAMRADVIKYEQKIEDEGGEVQFATINHAPGSGPPQGTNAGAVGAETAAYAVLPPTGLAALSIGQSDISLSYVPVNMRNIVDVTRYSEIENPVNLATGAFDISFVIIFLLPIFILALTYDVLSSEKEQGTLAMIMAHPISLRELMTCKLITRFMILLGVVAVAGLASTLAVGTQLDNPETWMRFGFWAGACLLYGMFWFFLAVFVNAMGKSSATNGLILAGSWLLFVVIVPTLVSIVATTLYPAPSRMDLVTASREAQTEASFQYMKALDEFYYDHLELVPNAEDKARDFLTLSIANSEAIEKEVRPLYDQFQSQLNRQEGLVQQYQYLSPAIMMQQALNEVSGTSADRYEDFMGQVFDFHKEWKDYFAVRFLSKDPLVSADYDRFPEFEYRPESLSDVIARLSPALIGLFGVMILAGVAAFVRLRSYQVAAR
jgi:ABC-2 type transport system permease protein